MHSVARGIALFLGGFILLNCLAAFTTPGFDANLWLVDLRYLPRLVGTLFLVVTGAALLLAAVRVRSGRIRATIAVLLAIFAAALVHNSTVYYLLLLRADISSQVPVPFTAVLFLAIVIILLSASRRNGPVNRLVMWLTLIACAVVFPLLQLLCFGMSDYRRPADAAIVLGARAYPDGTLSLPLHDRVQTGIELYRRNLVPRLIFSGGPIEASVTLDETEAMQRAAIAAGVPLNAITRDPLGLNTEATVRNTIAIAQRTNSQRLILVSHFYHLPRIKMTYQRYGVHVLTVPAETTLRPDILVSSLREVAALWRYYLRAFGV